VSKRSEASRIEVDVTPAQAGHLAAAQASKRKLPRDRVPIALDVFKDLLQLRRREGVCRFRVRRDAVHELRDVTNHVTLPYLIPQLVYLAANAVMRSSTSSTSRDPGAMLSSVVSNRARSRRGLIQHQTDSVARDSGSYLLGMKCTFPRTEVRIKSGTVHFLRGTCWWVRRWRGEG
jgi:hypothetical protein